MFESLQLLPPDAIIGLIAEYHNDTREPKVDLGIGVYRDAAGQTPILDVVKEAERRIVESQTSKSYIGSAGSAAFNEAMRDLTFAGAAEAGRIAMLQTPGGSGSLRVAAGVVLRARENATVWASSPTWANHVPLLGGAGLELKSYAYYDDERKTLDLDAMLDALHDVPKGDIVLLHASCHNPTGIDPDEEQWRAIADVIVERDLLPFIDVAYQGFGEGIDEDVSGLREFAAAVPEMLLTVSSSKSFGIYRERAGLLSVILAPGAVNAKSVRGKLRDTVRQLYFMAPDHGAAIVHEILSTPDLEALWRQELDQVRRHVRGMRADLKETIEQANPGFDGGFLVRQHGMFSCLPITPDEQRSLEERYHIYVLPDARVNVAAMNASQSATLAEAFAWLRSKRASAHLQESA